MKTTVDIDDELLIAAKKRAAELRRPLRALIEDGLRAQLREPARARPVRIDWVVVDGGLPDLLPDVSDRTAMHAWVRGERERVR